MGHHQMDTHPTWIHLMPFSIPFGLNLKGFLLASDLKDPSTNPNTEGGEQMKEQLTFAEQEEIKRRVREVLSTYGTTQAFISTMSGVNPSALNMFLAGDIYALSKGKLQRLQTVLENFPKQNQK